MPTAQAVKTDQGCFNADCDDSRRSEAFPNGSRDAGPAAYAARTSPMITAIHAGLTSLGGSVSYCRIRSIQYVVGLVWHSAYPARDLNQRLGREEVRRSGDDEASRFGSTGSLFRRISTVTGTVAYSKALWQPPVATNA